MPCGATVVLSAASFCIAASFSRMDCATLFQLASSSDVILSSLWRLVIRCSTVSPLVSAASAAAWLCIAELSARAMVSGLARSVAPSSAVIANERESGAVKAKRELGYDIVLPFQGLQSVRGDA